MARRNYGGTSHGHAAMDKLGCGHGGGGAFPLRGGGHAEGPTDGSSAALPRQPSWSRWPEELAEAPDLSGGPAGAPVDELEI
jgi:hypothetical protein